MIKSDRFTVTEDPPTYLYPDSLDTGSALVEAEDGGFGISDPSLTISGWRWTCQYTPGTGDISLRNEDRGVSTSILTGIMDLVSLSFAFDANMRPALGYYNTTGEAFLYFYDALAEAYTTIQLPAGSTAPKLCHDDKRYQMVLINITDVLCFYTRGTSVIYRLQRERYQNEHIVATVTDGTVLTKVGMSNSLQLRIEITNGRFVSSP